jgi:copper(I)-binding protein
VSRSFLARKVAAAAAVGAAAVLAAACSAGQTAQTAMEQSTVDGASADAGSIALRNVRIAYPPNATYVAGSSAVLEFSAVNTGREADQLLSVKAPVAASVGVGPGAGQAGASASGGPGSTAPSTSDSTSGSSSPSGPTSSASPPGSSSAPAGEQAQVDLPPGALVSFGPAGAVVQLMGLTTDLVSGQTVEITFVFAKAGSVTVAVPVSTSLDEVHKDGPVPTGSGEGGE